MSKKINDPKLGQFIWLASQKHSNKPLLKAWYRGLPKLKQDLTPIPNS